MNLNQLYHSPNYSCNIEYVGVTSHLNCVQLIGNYKDVKMLFGKLNSASLASCFMRTLI